jgi:hypothetical protein
MVVRRYATLSTKHQTFNALHMNEFPVMKLQTQKQRFADQVSGYNMIAVEFIWARGNTHSE